MTKLIRVNQETWNFLKEFSERTSVDMLDLLDQFAQEGRKAFGDMDGGKILYLFAYDLKNRMVHLYLGNACKVGIPDGIPEGEILKLFDYRRNENGAIVDMRETGEVKPEQPKKLTHCEQIQAQHDADVAKELKYEESDKQ